MSRKIYVYADWVNLNEPALMGILSTDLTKGREIFSFEYIEDWIISGQPFDLDPNLKLYRGPQYNKPDKPNFGIFLDSSPDRWGRLLMKRREAILARKEGRKISCSESMMRTVWELYDLKQIRTKIF